MKKAMKRALGAGGALALAASAVLVPTTAAQADGGYYGAWTLTAWKINGKTIECPGKLPLPPPAPPIECTGGEYLELKSGYAYKTNLAVFGRFLLNKGQFDIISFSQSSKKTIIFDATGDENDPRAYQVKFQGTGDGAPKKMVIFTSTGRPGSETMIKMVFRRDAN